MAPTFKNNERCKRYREKHQEKYREDDKFRKRHSRAMLKFKGGLLYEETKKKNRERMRQARTLAKEEREREEKELLNHASTSTSSPLSSSFSSTQSRSRSIKRAEKSLPESPRKRVEVIGNLAKKYEIKIDLGPKRGRKLIEMSEENVAWLTNILERSDITYMNPGKNDNVYIGKVDGISQFVQKQYLLWTIRDLLGIINGSSSMEGVGMNESYTDVFDEDLSFTQLYQFLKVRKQYVWNKNIPEASCLCEICENITLFAKGVNKSLKLNLANNPHTLVEENSCDSSAKACMNGLCEDCETPITWMQFGTDTDENEIESEVSFYKWTKLEGKTQKVVISLEKEEAWHQWCESVAGLKEHIHRKRSQVGYYNEVKNELQKNECIVHVDYSESYCNKQQAEIQTAYFGRTNFSLFTACGYFRKSDESELTKVPMTVVSEANDQSRIAANTCVRKVIECIEERMPIANSLDKIIVWSDGCASQFRSRFVFNLLLSLYPEKILEWNYNEAHHGKGPMDGIGGTLKNQVYQHVKSGRVVISTPKEFAVAANEFVPSISTMFLPVIDIPEEPENVKSAPSIPGTLTIHQIKRKKNDQGVWFLEFFKLSTESEPFFTQFYREETDPIVCGHDKFDGGDNNCACCLDDYIEGGEWMQCPGCDQWYCSIDCFGK